ncbi:MAG: peptidoglycan DD-metalloendopeptidase family protein [Bacteroidaceae bacterium]
MAIKLPSTPKNRLILGIFLVIFLSSITIYFRRAHLFYQEEEDMSLTSLDSVSIDVEPCTYLYGICIDSMDIENDTIKSGEYLSGILSKYGVSAQTVNTIVKNAENVFDIRKLKAGNTFQILSDQDSIHKARYFCYAKNQIDWVVFELTDSMQVLSGSHPVQSTVKIGGAVINSSLWNAAVSHGISPELAMDLSDIYQWTIDFYTIDKGDAFKVLYDEMSIDGQKVGFGNIHGAWFRKEGIENWAIRYTYWNGKDSITGYWDENGKSLKSIFLKAPLRYSRISSRFSNSRYHPVLHIRRPHHGVDYAAPSGTPVHAIGDGTIIARGWSGGGGNMVKIRHTNGYMSGYLHLSRYAKGLHIGQRVKQGELIGYVGITGVATGPHLDFRIWSHGNAIDPTKIGQNKGPDIEKEYKAGFLAVKDSVVKKLQDYIIPNPIKKETDDILDND